MHTWPLQRALAERFWSLAEAAERVGAVDCTGLDRTGVDRTGLDRTGPVGVVRHVLDILQALDAGRSGGAVAPSTRAFLSELTSRERAGQLEYSAPEHASGVDSGERALVFSIGVLLFEGLTGRHPLGAVEGARRVVHLRNHELTALVTHSGGIPPALRALLIRAMDPAPEQRFASVAAIRAELEWYVVAEREGAYALAPRVERARKERRERTGMEPALPPVLIDPSAMVSTRPRSVERELDTAIVPRFDPSELIPRRRPERSAPPMPRVQEDEQAMPPRRSTPRSRLNANVRVALLAAGIALGSAATTAFIMLMFR